MTYPENNFRIILFLLFSLTIFTIYYIIIVRNHLVSLPPIYNYFILSSIFLFLTFFKMLVNCTFHTFFFEFTIYNTFLIYRNLPAKELFVAARNKDRSWCLQYDTKRKSTMRDLIILRKKYIKYVTQLLKIYVYICLS